MASIYRGIDMKMNKLSIPFLLLSILFSSMVSAEGLSDKEKGDWLWDNANSFNYAATMNRSGSVLSQLCYFESEKCMFVIDIDIRCEPGSDYPVLVSSDNGTQHLKLSCLKNKKDTAKYLVKPFKDVESIFESSNKIGFALGLDDGKFRVERFSLKGSKEMISNMLEDALQKVSTQNGESSDELPDGQYL